MSDKVKDSDIYWSDDGPDYGHPIKLLEYYPLSDEINKIKGMLRSMYIAQGLTLLAVVRVLFLLLK